MATCTILLLFYDLKTYSHSGVFYDSENSTRVLCSENKTLPSAGRHGGFLDEESQERNSLGYDFICSDIDVLYYAESVLEDCVCFDRESLGLFKNKRGILLTAISVNKNHSSTILRLKSTWS